MQVKDVREQKRCWPRPDVNFSGEELKRSIGGGFVVVLRK